jgi:hypothetical protein
MGKIIGLVSSPSNERLKNYSSTCNEKSSEINQLFFESLIPCLTASLIIQYRQKPTKAYQIMLKSHMSITPFFKYTI